MSRALTTILLLLLATHTLAQDLTDYLTPALRARVEKLKVDVRTMPSNATNLEERSRVLWSWANAYALSGGELPVNLTLAVALVFAYPDTGLDLDDLINGFIDEMTLLDEQPDALGTLSADAGPFEAGSFVTVHQTYTVGSRPIQTGGGILVARHPRANYGSWQTSDAKADNYVSIHTTARDVSFAIDSAPVLTMPGAYGAGAEATPGGVALVFRVASGTLQPGDPVTITYGDRSQGSRGFRMADFSTDRMPLPLYVAFTGTGRFFTLPIAPLVVTGAAVAGVKGFAPSVVAVNEPFTLAVRAQDPYYNRAVGKHPRWKVLLNGEAFKEIPASDVPIILLRNIELREPGIYRFTIESHDGSIHGAANPVLVKEHAAERIYWGDTHAHSGFGEGIGTPARFMSWARDDARLDFVSHSAHDVWLDDAEWEELRDNARRYTREGEFIAFLGYEWTVPNVQGGHHNVMFRTPENRDRVPAQFFSTLSRLYAGLRAGSDPRDVLVIPHAHEAADYRQSDPELEHLVEIASAHGNFEWLGRAYLEHGHQVGFTAASDNHVSQPGYSAPGPGSLAQHGGLAGVMAREKTTSALFDAMRARSAYATSGERIILDFSVNGAGMGQRTAFSASRNIRGRVIGTAPIDTVAVFRNGEEIWQQDLLTEMADKVKPQDSFLLSFASASRPNQPGDNPRGWRHWRGTVEIQGAELIKAHGQDFHDQLQQSLITDAANPNLLRFSTITRGDTSSILLELDRIKRGTGVKVVLEPTRETGDAPPLYRPHQALAGAEATLSVRDLDRGRVTVNLPADAYTDKITLRRIIGSGEMTASFEFDDTSEQQGDNYFLRVVQADDATAWSSPIWVGGYPER